ncbi:BtpA/SgcQ family protein [Paenibacillaceae bacterium WGS1546]|uniref:BtpA/SgcQ family protein n=1 Tax=Cohnella sp. WGS1546 TaxID=3366810 RepID=UPI00372CEB30
MNWLEQLTGTKKAVIAMCHLQALPGDPQYNRELGMEYVIEKAREDLRALQDGGVDAVMFSNEFSLPYLTDVRTETVASMARIIGELKSEIRIPYGVNVLWDAKKSLDLAVATDAMFVREIFTGVYGSDFGLWNTNVGDTVRHQHAIGAGHVKLLFNIVPESAKYIVPRDIAEIAKSTVFIGMPDALCVSGLTAGSPTDSQSLRIVKEAVPETVVLANTGVNAGNFREQLSIADGAVMGTAFKYDGKFANQVDVDRVRSLMDQIKQFRVEL